MGLVFRDNAGWAWLRAAKAIHGGLVSDVRWQPESGDTVPVDGYDWPVHTPRLDGPDWTGVDWVLMRCFRGHRYRKNRSWMISRAKRAVEEGFDSLHVS